jgi:hypothetical protein
MNLHTKKTKFTLDIIRFSVPVDFGIFVFTISTFSHEDGSECFRNNKPLPIILPLGLNIISKGICTFRWYKNNSLTDWLAQKAFHYMVFLDIPGLTVSDFRTCFNQIGWETCHLAAAVDPAKLVKLIAGFIKQTIPWINLKQIFCIHGLR